MAHAVHAAILFARKSYPRLYPGLLERTIFSAVSREFREWGYSAGSVFLPLTARYLTCGGCFSVLQSWKNADQEESSGTSLGNVNGGGCPMDSGQSTLTPLVREPVAVIEGVSMVVWRSLMATLVSGALDRIQKHDGRTHADALACSSAPPLCGRRALFAIALDGLSPSSRGTGHQGTNVRACMCMRRARDRKEEQESRAVCVSRPRSL